MKKLKTVLAAVLLTVFCSAAPALAASPYQTYIYNSNGEYTLSQNTYRPERVSYEGLATPEDLVVLGDTLYVADSGRGAIVLLDKATGAYQGAIGEGILSGVTGVFVNRDAVYAAIPQAEAVLCFNHQGALKQTYRRPDSPLFGKSEPFRPKKVAVDVRGNVYITGEGATNGIIQLDSAGGFGGYFGVNQAGLSFNMLMQRIFFTDSQKSKIFQNKPPAPDNIAVDGDGILYTVTQSAGETDRIKKLNIAGKNVFSARGAVENPADLTVDGDGNVYTISADGQIMVYDSFGNTLYQFGNQFRSTDRTGVFKQAVGIAVDENRSLYVADREGGSVTALGTTQIARTIFEGVRLYKDGRYVESMEPWQQTLIYNSGYALAHQAMGKAQFRLQNYESALGEFTLANDVPGYSQAFWELRNQWIKNYLPLVLLILVLLLVLKKVLDVIDRKKGIYNGLRRRVGWLRSTRLYREVQPAFFILRHPIDCCYNIKRRKQVKWPGFFLMLGWWIVETVLFVYLKSYIFSGAARDDINVLQTLGVVFVPVALWIVSNYLVSSINEGEGSFRETAVYSVTAWSPVFLFGVPLALLTNILTLNEGFVYHFIYWILVVWGGVNLCVCIKEIQDYSGREVVKNILLTLFTMVMLALALFIFYILADQVIQFIITFR